MQNFIRKLNIERFRQLLGGNPSGAEREVLERLLAEEESKPAAQPNVTPAALQKKVIEAGGSAESPDQPVSRLPVAPVRRID